MALPPAPPWEGSEAISGRGSARTAGTNRSTAVNSMSHKGYTARVEFDERDNIFVGRILGIRKIISFHGETVSELRAELESARRLSGRLRGARTQAGEASLGKAPASS